MWLRYGLFLLVCSTSQVSLTSDDEIASWVLAQERKIIAGEPATEKLDLTPSYIRDQKDKNQKEKIDLTPTNIQTTIDCLLDDGRRGHCIPYYQCDNNQLIIQDGISLIDFRKNRKCPTSIEVCCALPQPEVEAEDDVRTTNNDQPKSLNQNKMLTPQTPTTPAIDADECGWTNIQASPDKSKNVQRPQEAIFEEFRWMVAIIYKRMNVTTWVSNDYIGGGSLIHPSVVITAAHKVNKTRPREIKVRAGEFNIQTESETYKYQERDVKKKITHPEYFRASLYYDVTLVFLKKPFDLDSAPHIGLACLNKAMPAPDTQCFTMGWGLLPKDNTYATVLKKIPVPLVSPEVCSSKLRATWLGKYFEIHTSLTCAGGQEGSDACEKDGGSSLVCPINTIGDNVRYAVVGMVAYGIDCGVKDRPGVYVNVPAVYSWVDTVMTEQKYGTVTYSI